MKNLVLDSVWISKKGSICWTKSEISPDGEVISSEFALHVPAEHPQFDEVHAWLVAIGRL